jgi:hypothetical protein
LPEGLKQPPDALRGHCTDDGLWPPYNRHG